MHQLGVCMWVKPHFSYLEVEDQYYCVSQVELILLGSLDIIRSGRVLLEEFDMFSLDYRTYFIGILGGLALIS